MLPFWSLAFVVCVCGAMYANWDAEVDFPSHVLAEAAPEFVYCSHHGWFVPRTRNLQQLRQQAIAIVLHDMDYASVMRCQNHPKPMIKFWYILAKKKSTLLWNDWIIPTWHQPLWHCKGFVAIWCCLAIWDFWMSRWSNRASRGWESCCYLAEAGGVVGLGILRHKRSKKSYISYP